MGSIAHGRHQVGRFRKCAHTALCSAVNGYIGTVRPSTGRTPAFGIVADKMTETRITGQMAALQSILGEGHMTAILVGFHPVVKKDDLTKGGHRPWSNHPPETGR